MLKLKDKAIKTMAGALSGASAPEIFPAEKSSEIVYINRKLREAFKISVNPKNTPFPQTKASSSPTAAPASDAVLPTVKKGIQPLPQTDDDGSGADDDKKKLVGKEADKKIGPALTDSNKAGKEQEEKKAENEKLRQIEELEKIKKQLERQKLEEEKRAEKKKKEEEEQRLEAARLAEEEKKREEERIKSQKAEEERRRMEEEKAKRLEAARLAEEEKRMEEKKKREEEQRAMQEKMRQEALRIQEEKNKAREEKRLKLALLELEREKKMQEEQERQKQEAIRKAKEEQEQLAKAKDESKIETLAEALERLILKLNSKKISCEKQLASFPGLKAPLEQKKLALENQASLIKNNELAAIEEREKEIENQAAAEKEKLGQKLSPQQEKVVEQKLWTIEDRRKDIEKRRWDIEDRISKILDQAKAADGQINQKNEEEAAIKQKIKTIGDQTKLARFAIEKGKLEEEMFLVIKDKEKHQPLLEEATNKKNEAAAILKELSDKEISANAELDAIEQREKLSSDPAEKRTAEQDRWRVNEILKTTTQSKWGSEEKLKEAEKELLSLEEKTNIIGDKLYKLQNKISDGEDALEKEGLPAGRMRDSVAALFKENGIEIDPELLKDIIQTEDQTKKNGGEQSAPLSGNPSQKNTRAIDRTKPNTVGPSPATAAADSPQPAAKPAVGAPQQSQEPAKSDMAAKPAAAINTATEKPVKDAASEESQKTEKRQNDRIGSPDKLPAAAAPAPVATAAAVPPTQNIAGTPVASEIEKPKKTAADSDEDENANDDIWKPEIKPDTGEKTAAAAKTAGAAAKPASEPSLAAKTDPAPKAASPYREIVDAAPATNIRPFPEEKLSEKPAANLNSLPAAEKISAKNSTPKPDAGKVAESPSAKDIPLAETETPNPALWENRWAQIKKTASPAAVPASAALPQISETLPETIPQTGGKNKIIARVLVVFALVGIIGIILAIVLTKNNAPVVKKPAGGNATTTTPGKKTETADPSEDGGGKDGKEQSSYLAVVSTVPIYTEDLASVPNLLSPYLQTSLGPTGYYRVSILDKRTNSKVGLRQFFNIYKVNATSIFYNSVGDDFTLFIYSNNGKNRLGFVTPVTNAESLKTSMEGWEGSMRQDTDNLFKLLGRKTQDPQKELRFKTDNSTGGIEYRSMVFLPETDNFSINWAIYNDKYFVFATSADTLKKTFDQLPK